MDASPSHPAGQPAASGPSELRRHDRQRVGEPGRRGRWCRPAWSRATATPSRRARRTPRRCASAGRRRPRRRPGRRLVRSRSAALAAATSRRDGEVQLVVGGGDAEPLDLGRPDPPDEPPGRVLVEAGGAVGGVGGDVPVDQHDVMDAAPRASVGRGGAAVQREHQGHAMGRPREVAGPAVERVADELGVDVLVVAGEREGPGRAAPTSAPPASSPSVACRPRPGPRSPPAVPRAAILPARVTDPSSGRRIRAARRPGKNDTASHITANPG